MIFPVSRSLAVKLSDVSCQRNGVRCVSSLLRTIVFKGLFKTCALPTGLSPLVRLTPGSRPGANLSFALPAESGSIVHSCENGSVTCPQPMLQIIHMAGIFAKSESRRAKSQADSSRLRADSCRLHRNLIAQQTHAASNAYNASNESRACFVS